MNILVTESGYQHSLGIVRSLGKQGVMPYVLSHRKNSVCGVSKYSKQEIIVKSDYSKDDFIDKLSFHKIELVILVGSESFKKIIPWKDDLIKHNINIITVDKKTHDIASSKKETYALADEIGVPYPKTYYPQDLEEVNNLKDTVSYPCVIKGLYEVGINIVDYVYNGKELESKYGALCKKFNIDKNNGLPMLQEYIAGSGCAFFAVYNKGVCGLTFQHKRIRELPVSGGSSVCAESYKNSLVEKYGKMLLDSLNWHGVAMVEFKLNSENIPVLMEINAKFWGSLDLALDAGVNFPKALIDIHNNKKVLYSNKYKHPFRYHWFLGDFLHGVLNPKAIFPIILDCLNPKVKGNLWISDIKPTIKMIIDSCKILVCLSLKIMVKFVKVGK